MTATGTATHQATPAAPVRRGRRLLILNGDDLGLSEPVNRAVVEAHERGLLTSASLMVAAPAAVHAAELARARPTLEVGLHVVLCQGRAAAPPGEVPRLVANDRGDFPDGPVACGLRYFFLAPWLKGQLRREVDAQLDRFEALLGRPPAHVNGHLNIHAHPTVLAVILDAMASRRLRAPVRLPREPASLVLRADPRRRLATRWNGLIFRLLARRAARKLGRAGIPHADLVFGILRPGEMREPLLLDLLAAVPETATTVEAYFHLTERPDPEFERRMPGYDADGEKAALLSPRVREAVRARGFELGRYSELAAKP